MSEYLIYTLWRQREERMPHELEQRRVVQERLGEPGQERVSDVTRESELGEAAAIEETETAGETERELVIR